MIKSFKHKELQTFFETGSKKGIIPDHASKIARILDRLFEGEDVILVDYKDYH